MSIHPAARLPEPPGPQDPLPTATEPAPTHGLSALVVPGILTALAVFLIIGTANMELPPSVQVPGPTFFPIVVIVVLLAMAVLSTVQILREHRQHDTVPAATGTPVTLADVDGDPVTELPPDVPPGRAPWPAGAVSDWRAVGTVLASLVAFIVLLRPLGWVLAAALLFWGVCRALGGRRPIFDASVALVMSSLIQLLFGLGLGLNLPAGFLEGVL